MMGESRSQPSNYNNEIINAESQQPKFKLLKSTNKEEYILIRTVLNVENCITFMFLRLRLEKDWASSLVGCVCRLESSCLGDVRS